MEGLLTFILFGAFFYLMMRFGCGAHMVHGDHGHANGDKSHDHQHADSVSKNSDPVCGMEVEDYKGYGKMYEGALYRFCSRKCLDKFDADPNSYLKIKEGVKS
ncbi:MAG: YHS domain-containing protein [Nitrospinota bacterium]